MTSIQGEYQKAKGEGRQPLCPYCQNPLEIFQLTQEANYWKWDEERRCYIKEESGGDIAKPHCVVCQAGAWEFVDDDMVVL